MKLKKLVSAVACVVMAGVFATSAFAYDATQVADRRQKAVEYLISEGYESAAQAVAALSDEDIGAVMDSGYNIDTLKASVGSYEYAAGQGTEEAKKYIMQALDQLRGVGIEVGTPTFTFVNGAVVVDVTIGGVAVNETVDVAGAVADATSEHPEIGANKDENGNWHVDEATTDAAASVTTTAGSVIKATGDNSAVVLVAGVLAVATVLGLAVRKNSNIG